MYNAVDIANIFVDKGIKSGKPVTQMQLQKIVYFAHGVLLAQSNGEQNLVDEEFQAWDFGPVIPTIYHNFKQFGASPITPDNDFLRLMGRGHNFDTITISNPSHVQLLEEVWNALKDYDGIALSDWSHREGSAWSYTYDPNVRGKVIPNESVTTEFKSLYESLNNQEDTDGAES